MAYETGTASSHTDLYTKLISFLTTNAALVAANQNWTQVWTGTNQDGEVVLKGPGLGESDSVFVGIARSYDLINNNLFFLIRGMTGVIPTAESWDEHVNVSAPVRMFADNNPMTYWFVANGRRFVVVAKMSTVYESLYAGFFLPYANPVTYGYPMFIGGSSGALANDPLNWRSSDYRHSHFIDPSAGDPAQNDSNGSSRLITPTGDWMHGMNLFQGLRPSDNTINNINCFFVGPRMFGYGVGAYGYNEGDYLIDYRNANSCLCDAPGGGYILTPITLSSQLPSTQTFGILDGVYSVPGYQNAAENIIQQDGVDHLVVQNAFRTSVNDYWALALE